VRSADQEASTPCEKGAEVEKGPILGNTDMANNTMSVPPDEPMRIKLNTVAVSGLLVLASASIVTEVIDWLSYDRTVSGTLDFIGSGAALTVLATSIVTLSACVPLCFRLSPARLFLSAGIAALVPLCLSQSLGTRGPNPHGLGLFLGFRSSVQ